MATRSAQAPASAESTPSYLGASRGIGSWLLTRDHKRIALLYLGAVLSFFLVGSLLAMIMRLESLTPEGDLFAARTYAKMLTVHGTTMVFIVLVPAIPGVLGSFLLPLMIGARQLAFPRMSLAGLYVYLSGAVLTLWAVVAGGLDTGWTLAGGSGASPLWVLGGVFLLSLSGALHGINFIATIHGLRAPGLTWRRLPCFPWTLYFGSALQIATSPLLIILLLLVGVERLSGMGIFDPSRGGDPTLFGQFFWAHVHPSLYGTTLPAIGVIGELIATGTRRPLLGFRGLLFAGVVVAALCLTGWGQHLFLSGQSELSSAFFSATALGLALPFSALLLGGIGALRAARFTPSTSMLYALAFLLVWTIGVLSGLFLGTLATNVDLHGTYFVVGHAHYMMLGGTFLAFLGGLHHWWPKITGRHFSEYWGRIGVGLLFCGINLTFFAQLVLGSKGMLRRTNAYDQIVATDLLSSLKAWHTVSTVGSQILVLGFALVLYCLGASLFSGRKAAPNPCAGLTLEWATESPPPPGNFTEIPSVTQDPWIASSSAAQAGPTSPGGSASCEGPTHHAEERDR